MKKRFKTTVEQDQEFLKTKGLSFKKYIAITYRLGQKRIVLNNIKLLQILMRILVRFKGGTPQEVKTGYMSLVEDYETPEEIIPNRLKLRRYLRELVLNQSRLGEQISEEKQKIADEVSQMTQKKPLELTD